MSEYDKLKPLVEIKSAFDNKGKRLIPSDKASPKRQKFLNAKKANEQRERRNQRALNANFNRSDRRPLPEDREPPSAYHKNVEYTPSPDFVSFATLRIKTRVKTAVIKSILCELGIADAEGDATAQGLHLLRKGRDGKVTYHKSLIDVIKQEDSMEIDDSLVFEI
jgi:hypothetical protein